MNKQFRKRMFAHLIFYSLLLNVLTPILALAETDQWVTESAVNRKSSFHPRPCCHKEKDPCKEKKPKCKDETFDFVIVGAGQAGCVLANRLSENGQCSVCVLEAGRDDARLSELLPEPSAANVPQPGDYHWGQYVRGATFFVGAQLNRGFGSWWFYEQTDRPNGFNSTTYTRGAQWGGCSSQNDNVDIRNAPYNWNQWVALGLTDWDASTPASPLVQIYKKIENRSQALFGTAVPFYDPGIPGQFGGFDTAWYGFDGEVPILHGFPDAFTTVLQGIVGTTLSSFNYPLQAPGVARLVDLDYPPTTMQGGLSILNATLTLQVLNETITEPGNAPAPGNFTNNVPFAIYNFPKYGDTGFKVPQEYQDLNDPTLDPAALQLFQRVSSANTYLYDAQNRPNLTIKSDVLVTKLIVKDKKATGVEYLKGGNIYQTGRNPNTSQAGYGGTVGDARFNGIAAKESGKCRVFARKAVVLCAGVFNTPQILNLSGIGNKFDLEPLGIKSKLHLPGVGQHLIDDAELFLIWQKGEGAVNNPITFNTLATFVNPTDSTNGIPPVFDLLFVSGSLLNTNCESKDPFVQKFWAGLRNVPAIYSSNTRNTFHNILLDTTNPTANPGPITVVSAGAPVPPTPPDTGPWAVTFTIPSSTVSAGGYTVSGNANPNYNGKFTASAFDGVAISATTNNVPGVTTITLLYPTDPGVFGGGVTTLTGDAAFLPIMVNHEDILGLLVEQEEDNLSEGFVKLVSSDPTVPPFIHMPFLSDPHDLQAWIDVMNNTVFPVWQALKATSPAYFKNLLFPSPEDILIDGIVDFSSGADVDQAKLRTFLLNYTGGHHAQGTCKMGVVGDPTAVVDQHGKVFGMDNLYIADMSVTPVSGRWPNGMCYVIAEKIAADIKAAYCGGGYG